MDHPRPVATIGVGNQDYHFSHRRADRPEKLCSVIPKNFATLTKPPKIELLIKAARAFGVFVPLTLLGRADEVIEVC
jgi:hypothetical protein